MGSETELIYLDDWLMEDKKKYRDFALEIIQKKFNPENILDIKEYKIFLLRLFDESSGRICDSGKAFKSLTAELKKNVTNSVIQGIIKNLKNILYSLISKIFSGLNFF
jgi:hypothetical protein